MGKILRMVIPHLVPLYLFLCLLVFDSATASSCNPSPRPGVDQFLIGYGSLMSTASKNRTYPNTLPNVPINVKGYARSWNCKGVSPSMSTTYLGVYPKSRVAFNGVLFKLSKDGGAGDEQALKDYDHRERFYCRQEVERSKVEFLCKNEKGNCSSSLEISESKAQQQFWIYVTKPEFSEVPSAKYPIVQSYVDTWLTGCLEMEKNFGLNDFAKTCILSTEGWSDHWENDRLMPRRAFLYEPNAAGIDSLLHETLFRGRGGRGVRRGGGGDGNV